MLNDYHLTQLNTSPTRNKHAFDPDVVTNVPSQVDQVSLNSPAESGLVTDHATVVLHVKTSFKAAPKIERKVFDFNRANFDVRRTTLEAANLCDAVESEVDVD